MAVIRIQLGIAHLKPVAFWTLAITLSAFPARAQKGGSSSGGSGGLRGGSPSRPVFVPIQPGTQPNSQPNIQPGEIVPTTEPVSKPVVAEDESCLPWALPDVRATSVSAIRLGVPAKARSQYKKACGALKKNNLTEAELHARNAIQKYPKYPAAWVMLGQVLQDEQKLNEAHDACSKPLSADPTYLPPYLCLAGLLNREENWGDLVTWSDQFRGKNPAADMYAHYYRGLALYHLRNFPEAQKSALQAVSLDTEHRQPGFNFLAAQIYGEQGDLPDATIQVQQFVKFSNSRQDRDSAREFLSELQTRLNAK